MRELLRTPSWLLLLPLLLVAVGCGSDDGGTEPAENLPPTVTLTVLSDITDFVEGEPPILVQATANDPDGANEALTLSWTVSGSAAGTLDTDSGPEVNWTPGAGPGDATITVTVSDGIDEVSRSTLPLSVGVAVRPGDLDAGATWTAVGGPYVILDDVTLPHGQTLTLEPGTEVRLRPRADDSMVRLSILGQLIAEGTSSAAGDRIRFRGGRDSTFEKSQHRGVTLQGAPATMLRYVTFEHGQAGLTVNGGARVDLLDCTFKNNQTGVEASGGAVLHLFGCRVEDNSSNGGVISGSVATFRDCVLQENSAAGLAVSSSSQSFCQVNVDKSWFYRNDGPNLQIGNALGFVSVDVDSCNFRVAESEGENVALLTCIAVTAELDGNYWGDGFESGIGVLQTFRDQADCDLGVADWVAGVDFYTSAIAGLPNP